MKIQLSYFQWISGYEYPIFNGYLDTIVLFLIDIWTSLSIIPPQRVAGWYRIFWLVEKNFFILAKIGIFQPQYYR